MLNDLHDLRRRYLNMLLTLYRLRVTAVNWNVSAGVSAPHDA